MFTDVATRSVAAFVTDNRDVNHLPAPSPSPPTRLLPLPRHLSFYLPHTYPPRPPHHTFPIHCMTDAGVWRERTRLTLLHAGDV